MVRSGDGRGRREQKRGDLTEAEVEKHMERLSKGETAAVEADLRFVQAMSRTSRNIRRLLAHSTDQDKAIVPGGTSENQNGHAQTQRRGSQLSIANLATHFNSYQQPTSGAPPPGVYAQGFGVYTSSVGAAAPTVPVATSSLPSPYPGAPIAPPTGSQAGQPWRGTRGGLET
jgi:hypothetical protein